VAIFGQSAVDPRTVRLDHADGPPSARGSPSRPRGLSAERSRAVRLVLRRASCVLLPLWDCLGFVHTVGRFVVTT
jgi:hypothetical protein